MRAMNGGQVSRLQFSQENLTSQATNMQAALGRIMDVDVAEETANLAKRQILVQASASMVAQANTANNVALMLLQKSRLNKKDNQDTINPVPYSMDGPVDKDVCGFGIQDRPPESNNQKIKEDIKCH